MQVLVLVLSALCSLSSCLDRQYYFVNMNMSWTDAQSYCRQNYTDLATIDSTEEMTRMISSVDTGYTGAAWIGLINDVKNWQLSLKGLPRSGYPAANQTSICAFMPKQGSFLPWFCDTPYNFICYDGRSNATQRYISILQAKSWMDAVIYCRQHYTDLASMLNESVQMQAVQKSSVGWIGLYRPWQWSDGENLTFTSWVQTTRRFMYILSYCGVQWFSGGKNWDYAFCTDKLPFFCYDDLLLVQENKSWSEALTYCRNEKMDLVSVSSKNIQNQVERRLKNATSTHVWLGLRFTCTLSFWFWVDREPLRYTNWAPGNGTGDGECDHTGAVEAGGGHLWVSRPDSDRLNFICAKCRGN